MLTEGLRIRGAGEEWLAADSRAPPLVLKAGALSTGETCSLLPARLLPQQNPHSCENP